MSKEDEIIELLGEIRDTQQAASARPKQLFRAWIVLSCVYLPVCVAYLIWAMFAISKH
jgi:uncharacterized membrane protein YhdT